MAESKGRKDMAQRIMSNVLNENRDVALAKRRADQKHYMIKALTVYNGLERGGMWGFMEPYDGKCEHGDPSRCRGKPLRGSRSS